MLLYGCTAVCIFCRKVNVLANPKIFSLKVCLWGGGGKRERGGGRKEEVEDRWAG